MSQNSTRCRLPVRQYQVLRLGSAHMRTQGLDHPTCGAPAARVFLRVPLPVGSRLTANGASRLPGQFPGFCLDSAPFAENSHSFHLRFNFSLYALSSLGGAKGRCPRSFPKDSMAALRRERLGKKGSPKDEKRYPHYGGSKEGPRSGTALLTGSSALFLERARQREPFMISHSGSCRSEEPRNASERGKWAP